MEAIQEMVLVSGYARIRRDLDELADEFDNAAATFPPICAQIIYKCDSIFSWSDFWAANPGNDLDWQETEVCGSNDRCIRYCGYADSLPGFRRLAPRGYDLLLALHDLQAADGFIAPESMDLQLPDVSGYLGWIQLIFNAARCFATATLQAKPGFWGHTGSVDVAKVTAPFFEELRSDLFSSSAEAIRVWLDPSQAVSVGDFVEESWVCLPPPPEQDGPAYPDAFWFHGKRYKGFAPKGMRLLERLFGREGVSLQAAIESVYGEESDEKETAILSLQKRLSRRLLDQEAPVEVIRRDGKLYLISCRN